MSAKHPTPREREKEERFRDAVTLAKIIREKGLAEQHERSLKSFLKGAWPIIDPGSKFVDGWHIDCICEHVEAIFRREIRRLIINIAPRSAKSSIISVAAPAWRWLQCPQEKFLCASYGRNLSLGFSRKTRNLIASPWYQARWSEKFAFVNDQNEKGEFENSKGGFRIAASVEGGILGRGGSVAIYDDPNDLDEMGHPAYRQSVKDWYSGTASSRYIDPKTDVRLCVQQRASYGDDLTAYLMELGGWEQLVIPNEFDGRRARTSIGWTDPRTHIGELMQPARFGPEEVAILKREQRANYSGQFQQAPLSDGTESLRREWFRFYNPPGTKHVDEHGEPIPVTISGSDGKAIKILPVDLPSAFEHVVDSWDCAFKNADHNDYVAGQQWGRIGANSYLLAREHGHWNFPETLAAVRRLSIRGAPEKLVEDKANGTAVMDVLRNEIPGLIPVEPNGGKWARVAAVSGYIEAGNVFLPNPDLFPWVWDLLKEFSDGRSSKHDDDTDAMSQALMRLYNSMARTGVPEFRVQPRLGEPQTACHVAREMVPAIWRRVVAIVPGAAALWLAETPSGSLRVLRELSLNGMDASTAGREIGRLSLPDALARTVQIRDVKRQAYELLLPKEAFAAVEPIGSYAELLERSILEYQPEEGDWDARQRAKAALREAHFRTDMIEEKDAAVDRLRSLLAFQPPDFQQVPYNRQKAMALSEHSLGDYADYMAAVDGEVRGEWPKLKISPDCPKLIAELGSFRRDRMDEAPPLVQALLLAVCAPRQNKPREVVEQAWPVRKSVRNGTLLSRRFSLGR